MVFSNAVQGSDGQRWSARAEAEELCGASASPPPALSVPVLFRAEVGPPAQKRGPSGCPAWSPAPLCRSRGTRLSHSPSCSSRGGASKRLIWLGSPCQEELRTSGRGGLEGLRCARRGGALRERWGDLLSRRSLVRCSLPRGRRVGARPEGRQPRRNRVPTYWRHRGQSDLLEVQRWMHSLQKMCLQGSARTASAIGPRQMGHGSSWASGGHAHASRLLLAAASRLMAAAALAPSKEGVDLLEAASCRAVSSLRASTRSPLAELCCHTHWQGLSGSCSHRKTFAPRESPARLSAGWARWGWVGTRPTVRSRGDCDSPVPSRSTRIGGRLLPRGYCVRIWGICLPERTQGLSLGRFPKQ